MKNIHTTLGLIELGDLGRVDVHEHLIIEGSSIERMYPEFIHGDAELISYEVKSWKRAGGGVLVDSSPIGAGRSPRKLERVSRLSGVPIIISTGFHKSTYYSCDHWVYERTVDQIHKIILKECSLGVLVSDNLPARSERSTMRAGMVKAGIDSMGLTPFLKKILKAAYPIIKNLNIPLMIHTEKDAPYMKLADWLESNNFPSEKIVFCHMDKSPEFDLHRELTYRGYFIEYDSMVRKSPTIDKLVKLIIGLFENNLGNKLLFAGDLARKSYWKCYGGNPGLTYLISGLNSKLIEVGISKKEIDQIWMNNPRSLFYS